MPSSVAAPVSRASLWAGRILTVLLTLFLALDAVMKFIKPPPVVQSFAELGWPVALAVPLGIVLLVSVILYLIPQTCVLGAILLTGYLGGAVATHLRIGQPLFSHTLFPVYIGVLLWLALYLRDASLRKHIPLRNQGDF